MAKIEFEDKVALIENPDIPDINKVKADDMNEIKSVVNENDDKFLTNGLNVSNEVDNTYRVNLLEGNNMFNENIITNIWSEYGTGNITNVSGANLQRFNCQEGDTFTLKATFDNPDSSSIILIAFYSSNGTLLSRTTQNTVWEMTLTAPTNSAYMYAGHSTTKPDTIMLNKGDEALTYSPFVSNQILVDNEKYTDTINVGTSLDNRSRVNVLYSKNLFDMNNVNSFLGYFTSQVSVITGTGSGVKILYIPCKPNTTYTVQKVASKRFSLATTRVEPAVGVAFYGGVFGTTTTTQLTITTESQAQYLIVEYYIGAGSSPDTLSENTILSSIIINEGTIIVDTPSIYVDNEEIYSKPVVLWQNSSPTSAFAGGNYNLRDNIQNYSYYEIIYSRTNGDVFTSSGKIPIDKSALTYIFRQYFYVRGVNIVSSGAAFNSGDCVKYESYGSSTTSTDNNYCIPYQILGYK